MPTLADLFSLIESQKRKASDFISNPGDSLMQMLGNANDRARAFNELNAQAAQEKDLTGPANKRLQQVLADAYNPAGMMVYHGSPFKFGAFSANKIGSGEGAQAYGYGHYLAEAPETANQYKETLKSKAFSKIVQRDRNVYDVVAPDGTVVSQGTLLGQAHKAKDAYDANIGSVYKIDLPDEQIAKMLDFDKPLMQQSKEIQGLAKQYGLTDADHLGGDLIAAMNAKRPAGAEAMRQAGVPGIRYLDQGSRATPNITNQRLADLYEKHQGNAEAAVDEMMRSVYNTPKKKQEMREAFLKQLEAKKTSNFVVFPGNEGLLKMLEMNNKPMSFWGF